jgi:hypothetical protein
MVITAGEAAPLQEIRAPAKCPKGSEGPQNKARLVTLLRNIGPTAGKNYSVPSLVCCVPIYISLRDTAAQYRSDSRQELLRPQSCLLRPDIHLSRWEGRGPDPPTPG